MQVCCSHEASQVTLTVKNLPDVNAVAVMSQLLRKDVIKCDCDVMERVYDVICVQIVVMAYDTAVVAAQIQWL